MWDIEDKKKKDALVGTLTDSFKEENSPTLVA